MTSKYRIGDLPKTIIDIEKLIPYANNSNIHPENQIKQIMAAINEFGFLDDIIIDENNMILDGHGRVEALTRLGINKVPAIIIDHLTKNQKKAFIIAVNKIARNSYLDNQILKLEIDDLINEKFEIDVLGFENDELDKILKIDDFEFKEPDEKNDDAEKILSLKIIFQTEEEQQDLFIELRDRGFKVKV